MLSETPLTPGRSAHAPRTIRSILTPACEAAYRALITASSTQRVHFGDDARGLALLGVARLAPDRVEQMAMHRERREPQALEPVGLGEAGDVQEYLVDVGAHFGVRGQQPEIGVHACGAGMVVAGAQVRVALQPRLPVRIPLAPQQQRQLGVRLQSEHTVDDLRAHVRQPLRPVDVGLLVEARHQLDDDRDFLAAPRGLDQRLHQHRVDARAIDRLLDRDHVRIVGRLADELDHRLEGLERVVQQDVVLAQRSEQVGLVAQAVGQARAGTADTSSSSTSTWSMSADIRARFTGPSQR